MVKMIYPKKRWVSEEKVRSWATDLAADAGELNPEADEAWEDAWQRFFKELSLEEAKERLSDAGKATFKA